MKPPELERLLVTTYKHQMPTWIEGPPGIGKSQIHQQVAERLDLMWFPPLYPAMLDPTDVAGMPIPVTIGDTRRIERLLDDWLYPVFSSKQPGVLLIDEVSQGAVAVQCAVAPLLDSRRVGRHKLPEHITVCAAGNGRQHKAGAQNILTHIISRTIKVNLEVDPLAWVDRAVKDEICMEVISFVRTYPGNLHIFDPEKAFAAGTAYPNPRSWYKVSDLLRAGLDRDLESEVFKGTIGDGVTQLLLSHIMLVRDQVDIAAIMQGAPWKFPNKDKIGARFAFVIGVGACANAETTQQVVAIATELYDRKEGEYAEVVLQTAIRAYDNMINHPAWRQLRNHPLGKSLIDATKL